jgi:hypothetical protein
MRQSLCALLISIFLTGITGARSPSDIDAVRTTILAWGKAWESKNIDYYMSFYSPSFRSDDVDYHGWREKKTSQFQRPGPVTLKINELWVFVEKDGAEVRFTQHYESRDRSDVGEKTMFLAKSNGTWKILWEGWKPFINLTPTAKKPDLTSNPRRSIYEIEKKEKDVSTGGKDLPAEKLKVRRIEFQIEKERENVFVELNRFSIPVFLTLEGERPRFVIDIQNVSSWKGRYKVPVHGKYITQIRSYHHRDLKKLRIVLDLKTDIDYMLSQKYDMNGNIYMVTVTEAKKNGSSVKPSDSE